MWIDRAFYFGAGFGLGQVSKGSKRETFRNLFQLFFNLPSLFTLFTLALLRFISHIAQNAEPTFCIKLA